MIHILNTTIFPSSAPDGGMTITTITEGQARALIALRGGVVSHVGHESTAAIATEVLGVPVPMDRTPWDGSGEAIAIQLNGRPPEGVILTREQIETLGYTLRHVRIATYGPAEWYPLPKGTESPGLPDGWVDVGWYGPTDGSLARVVDQPGLYVAERGSDGDGGSHMWLRPLGGA